MEKLRAAYRTTVIIGLAIMASLVAYLVIVSLMEEGTIPLQKTAVTDLPLDIVKFVLLGASAVLFFLDRFINARILAAGGRRVKLPDSRPQLAAGVAPEFGPLVTAAVVTFALCEVPAVFGLVLYFLGRNASDFHVFLLISLFFFAVRFPRFSQWEEWYRKQGGGMKR